MTSTGNVVAACAADELERRGKKVVDVNGVPVLLMWNGGDLVALNDTCIHRGRSLSEGVVFAGRLVCAGHQWAFDLKTGYCKVRERFQPVYPVVVEDGTVLVGVPPQSEGAAETPAAAQPVDPAPEL